MFDRFIRLARGDNKDCAPLYPIEFWDKSSDMLTRFVRLANGNRRFYAPISRIEQR